MLARPHAARSRFALGVVNAMELYSLLLVAMGVNINNTTDQACLPSVCPPFPKRAFILGWAGDGVGGRGEGAAGA